MNKRPVLPSTRKGGNRNKKKKFQYILCQIIGFTFLFFLIGTFVYHGITLYSNTTTTTTTTHPVVSTTTHPETTTVVSNTTTKKKKEKKKEKALRAVTDEIQTDTSPHPSDAASSIGYVISITGCPGERTYSLYDGAAVLKHSIDLIHTSSKYSTYQLHAFVHTSAVHCSKHLLQALHYNVQVVDVPIQVHEIENEWTRTNIVKGGCCNEKELIKLYAYTLKQHSIVIHLDVDTLLLQPLDVLFDTMLQNDTSQLPSHYMQHPSSTTTKKSIDFMFTRDYNMASRHTKNVGVQGGFFLLKPSDSIFSQFVHILRKGHYTPSNGWGDAGYGPFYGSMTIQGLLPYFYDHVQTKQTSLELSRCYFNNMSDNPRENPTVNNVVSGNCKDFRQECMDCRTVPIHDLFSVHYTLCYKPWTCSPHSQRNLLQHGQCYEVHEKWFQIRHDFQQKHSLGNDKTGHFMKEHFLGYCHTLGEKGYIPIPMNKDYSHKS